MLKQGLFGRLSVCIFMLVFIVGCSSARLNGAGTKTKGTGVEYQKSVLFEPANALTREEWSPGPESVFGKLDTIQLSVYGKKEFSRIDRIEILVESCKARIIGSDAFGAQFVMEYSVATAMRGALSNALPYGVVGEVYMVALNPKWTPTQGMIDRALAKGQRPPKATPPGAKDNPLGNMKLYFVFSFRGKKITDLGMHATTKAHQAEIRDGRENRFSTGCVRGKDPVITLNMKVFLRQNGKDPDALFAKAKAHPGTTINISLTDRPTVVYLRE
jgi:hypothetical protein